MVEATPLVEIEPLQDESLSAPTMTLHDLSGFLNIEVSKKRTVKPGNSGEVASIP